MNKMKNNFIKNLMLTLLALTVVCASEAFAISPEIKFGIKKLSLAMIGVLGSSVILFLGLSFYNKFFVSSKIKNPDIDKLSFRNPTDIDEAINMFIARNRLK